MYFKFLTADHLGPHSSFDFTPYLPRGSRPGKWLPKIDSLKMCNTGYHVTEFKHWRDWRDAELFEVEVKGDVLHTDTKSAFQQIRLVRKVDSWDQKTLVRFAVKCAKRSLPNFEKAFPDDKRVADCIKTVEAWLRGTGMIDQLNNAISAAYAAAWSAESAVMSVAESAAVRSAARSAAYAAESAAYAAAWSAESAVMSVARSAAESAVMSVAARSAEIKWQDKQLVKLLGLTKEVLK